VRKHICPRRAPTVVSCIVTCEPPSLRSEANLPPSLRSKANLYHDPFAALGVTRNPFSFLDSRSTSFHMRLYGTPVEMVQYSRNLPSCIKICTTLGVNCLQLESRLYELFGSSIAGVDVVEVEPPVIIVKLAEGSPPSGGPLRGPGEPSARPAKEAGQHSATNMMGMIRDECQHVDDVIFIAGRREIGVTWSRPSRVTEELYAAIGDAPLMTRLIICNETNQDKVTIPRRGDIIELPDGTTFDMRYSAPSPEIDLAPGETVELRVLYLPTKTLPHALRDPAAVAAAFAEPTELVG